MTRTYSTLLAVSCLLIPAQAAGQDDRDRLLDEVSARHRAAINAIRTVSFAFERTELKLELLSSARDGGLTLVGLGVQECGPGRYWQTPERWRSSARWSDGSTVDEVYRHHTLLSLRKRATSLGTPAAELAREPVSPWVRNGRDRLAGLLFGHSVPDTFASVPFHQLIEQPHQLLTVERQPMASDGPPGDVHVELSHGGGRYEFWFSPRHNHLIRKRVWRPADEPDHRHEAEVIAFAEPNRGQFFPSAVEYRVFDQEVLKQHIKLALTEVELNRPISNELFRIPGLAGMVCRDYTRQRSYHVDAEGYRVGEAVLDEQDGGRTGPRTTPPGVSSLDGADAPIPWWVWAVIASQALCLIAAVMEIRRLRTPPPTPPGR